MRTKRSIVAHSDGLSIQITRSFPLPFYERNQRYIYRVLEVSVSFVEQSLTQ